MFCQLLLSLDLIAVNHLADAIYRSEGGTNTLHPYGIMLQCHNPRSVCINTINHAWKDFERERTEKSVADVIGSKVLPVNTGLKGQRYQFKSDCTSVLLPFIQFLGARYCPPSVDSVGYRNWTNNVWRIYNKETTKT